MNIISYCVDFDHPVLLYNFEKRGWKHVCSEDYWNLYWSSIQTFQCLFNPDNNYRLNDNQIVNHFPNQYELCRKDLLIRNIRRYRREMQSSGSIFIKYPLGKCPYSDFIPSTYVLPVEYQLFVEDYRRKLLHNTWIVKPCGKSRGAGIFLINKLSQVSKWSTENKGPRNFKTKEDNYIISRYIKYIENPFLICGKKFDLRLYVLVTSFRPLKAYQFKYGFFRFCSVRYNTNMVDIKCLFAHLTNISLQKDGN